MIKYLFVLFIVSSSVQAQQSIMPGERGEKYSLLSRGKSGGQTIYGGISGGQNLTLTSTINTTKGKILFGTSAYDEVNNRLGIGLTSPTQSIDIATSSTGLTGLNMSNTGTGTLSRSGFLMNANSCSEYAFTYADTYTLSALADSAAIFSESTCSNGLILGTLGTQSVKFYINIAEVGRIDTSGNLDLNNTSGHGKLNVSGHSHSLGTAPTLTNCGTSPSIVGNDNVMRITLGTVALTGACTITFNGTWTNAPICFCNDETTATAATECHTTSPTTTTVVLTPVTAFVLSDKIGVFCHGYE